MPTAQAQPSVYSTDREVVLIAGRLTGNGTSAPTVTEGSGFTASRVSTGKYRITFDGKYPHVLTAQATILKGTEDDWTVFVDAIDVSNNRVDFLTFDDTGAAAADLTTADELNFLIVVQRTK